MRQSLVADSGPDLAALFSESLLESDSSTLWLASSLLTFTTESLSPSMVLPEASAADLSLGSVATLTGLEGILKCSCSGCLGPWLANHWMGGVMDLLLTLPSIVPVRALLQLWPSGVLPGEQSHFIHLRPGVSVKNGCPTGVPAAGMSHARGTGGGVLTLPAGLLIDTRAVVPSSPEVEMEVSTSLTEHVGPAPNLAVVENQKLLVDTEMMNMTSCMSRRC